MTIINYVTRYYREFVGKIFELGVNITHKPIIFQDPSGFFFRLEKGDQIATYYQRGSVSGSSDLQKYISNSNLQLGSTCIDIGCRVGTVSLPMWKKVGKSGIVISVDADPLNIEKIKMNFSLNGFPSKYVYHAAISNRIGFSQLRCYKGINGWQTLGDPTFASAYENYSIEVPTIIFSDLMEYFNLESADLVKIDVEGAEPMVLSGMVRFLQEKRIKCVIFEVNHLMLEGLGKTVDDLMCIWDNYDYDLYRLLSDGTLFKLSNKWPEKLIGDCIALARCDNY